MALKEKLNWVVEAFGQQTAEYQRIRREFDTTVHKPSVVGETECTGPRLSSSPIYIDHQHQVHLSRCSLEVLAAQENRDATEAEYIKWLALYKRSMEAISEFERSIGNSAASQSIAQYERILGIHDQIRAEDQNVQKLHTDIEFTKKRYRGAMLRLEEVSNAMHVALSQ